MVLEEKFDSTSVAIQNNSRLMGYNTVLTGSHCHFTEAFLHLQYLSSPRVAALKIWVHYTENCDGVASQRKWWCKAVELWMNKQVKVD
jgi:hypothetical protein